MSTTVNDLLIGAMRLINVVAAGETPSANDMNIALSAFDQMIDSWSNDKLMIYSIQPYIFNTVGGQQNYQMGPCQGIQTFGNIIGGSGYVPGTYANVPITTLTGNGAAAFGTVVVSGGSVTSITVESNLAAPGDITQGAGYGYLPGDTITVSNTSLGGAGTGFSAPVTSNTGGDWAIMRPMRIEQAYVIWNDPLSVQAVDITMQALNDAQFASLAVKNTPSNFPFAFYDNGNYPLRTLSLWPIPTQSTGIRFWLWQPLIDFTNLNTIVQYPPGYERAYRYNLAVELAPEFGKMVPPQVAAIAEASMANLATLNSTPQYMTGDNGLNGAKNHGFNWITGGFFNFLR